MPDSEICAKEVIALIPDGLSAQEIADFLILKYTPAEIDLFWENMKFVEANKGDRLYDKMILITMAMGAIHYMWSRAGKKIRPPLN